MHVIEIDPYDPRAEFKLENFAHILPIGDGPRAEYKPMYPNLDLNSIENVMLLCPNHHTIIDRTKVKSHPPLILFDMKIEQCNIIHEAIDDAILSQPEITELEYAKRLEIGSILELLWKARCAGPRDGMADFRTAEKLTHSLVKNPYFKGRSAPATFLEVQCHVTRMTLSYRPSAWTLGLTFWKRALQQQVPEWLLIQLLSQGMLLVRNEYGALSATDVSSAIALAIKAIDNHLRRTGERARVSRFLLIKSSLLRWRGRRESGRIQKGTFGESERCASLSQKKGSGSAALLQIALVNYAMAMSMGIGDAPKHEAYLTKCFSILESDDLREFPAAVSYRPRFYREIYKFTEAIEAFWKAVPIQPHESHRTAYVLGEAAIGKFSFTDTTDIESVRDALHYVKDSIERGYSHGRNLLAYVSCRAALDPKWFREEVLDTLLRSKDMEVEWLRLLEDVKVLFAGLANSEGEAGFGLDEGEFWNTLGSVSGNILMDHGSAIRFFEIASRHAEVSGGKFRALIGLARQHLKLENEKPFLDYLRKAKSVGRAHQSKLIQDLEKQGLQIFA